MIVVSVRPRRTLAVLPGLAVWAGSVSAQSPLTFDLSLALNTSGTLEGSLTLSFPIGERRPMVGVAYARDAFRPLELFSVEPYINSRIRFLLGLELWWAEVSPGL